MNVNSNAVSVFGLRRKLSTTKFKIEIPVKKEIKSISFRIVSDNFYTNGDPTGNACKQKTLIQSAVCYDDECVAVLRDDINANTSKITANTSKITANTTKLTTEISDRQAADDELKGKIKYGELERQAIVENINELEHSKVGSNDRVTGKEMDYSVTELLKWVAEGLEKSNSINYPGLAYIISDVYEMYNALCSYGFQEPIEVVKTVAELKNQAENK